MKSIAFPRSASTMYRFLVVCLLLLSAVCGIAENGVSRYDLLSRKSSEELMDEGRKYFELRQPGKALSCFQLVSERYKDNDNPEEAIYSVRALNNCGCVYKYFYYDYIRAYEYFTKAYDLCESIGDSRFLPVILVNFGDLLNDYSTAYGSESIRQQADSILNECMTKAVEEKNWELMTTAFFNLSNNNYDIDLRRYDAIFSKEIPDSTPDLQYVRLLYKGMEKMQQKRYPEARKCFERQFAAVNTRWQAHRDTLATFINIAETYKREQNYSQAVESLEQTLHITSHDDIRDLAASIYMQLSDCYRQLGDSAKAQRYHILYLEKKEEMHNTRLSNIAELKYISELNKEAAKARELAVHHKIQKIVILAITFILLIVLLFAVFIWRQNRILHAREKSLFEKYRQTLANEESESQKAKYSHRNLNDLQREALVTRIKEVLADPDIICQQGFSSNQLASLVDSNTAYVSQVINETYGISFSILLGNCRVREACRRINNSDRCNNLTIEGIANSVGFKSRTALLNAFKREVGITPSEYIRMAAKEKRKQAADGAA